MQKVVTNRQRRTLYDLHGTPILALECDVFTDGQVSLWSHTRHEVPFATMQAAFEAVVAHLQRLIADGAMCPFHPRFGDQAEPMEGAHD